MLGRRQSGKQAGSPGGGSSLWMPRIRSVPTGQSRSPGDPLAANSRPCTVKHGATAPSSLLPNELVRPAPSGHAAAGSSVRAEVRWVKCRLCLATRRTGERVELGASASWTRSFEELDRIRASSLPNDRSNSVRCRGFASTALAVVAIRTVSKLNRSHVIAVANSCLTPPLNRAVPGPPRPQPLVGTGDGASLPRRCRTDRAPTRNAPRSVH